ncbi:MAG: glycosyl hydrolase family 28-related protein [Acidobacteriota bacterium]
MSEKNIPQPVFVTLMLMGAVPLAFFLFMLLVAVPGQPVHAQTYSLPNDNTACPGNCRVIPWQAGSDLWNNGTLPTYPSVNCTGLAGNGTTNDGPAIQACINNAAANTAVYLPAGTYLVNSVVRLKSNVVLRGAGSTTAINLGAGGQLTTQAFSASANLTPATSYGNKSAGYALSGAPKKGDTTITISSGSVNPGDWIAIFADDDPTLVNATGEDGRCEWCADNTGYHLMQQIDQVTAVSGTTATLARPLYYTLYKNPAYRRYNFLTQKAGYESFRVTATGDIGSNQIILLQGCLYCWVKAVETNDTGSQSGSAHVELDYTYGSEIRDGYYHDQRSGASGAGYGVFLNFINSDAKIENNVMRHNRHGIVFQGGGSGIAVLYNYIDDEYTDDLTYLGSARTSHGAHPYMNLWEGNVISHIAADDFWGSSSHFVFFRNWLWGDETGTGVPSFPPEEGFDAIDLYNMQTYYSFVGNVLGHLNLHTNWANATLQISCTTGSCGYESASSPGVYSGGTAVGSIPSSLTTALFQGNYDYKTQGVAYWNGGANHTLAASMYYPAEPAYLHGYPWPLEGPEGNPTINANAAENCYLSGPAKGSAFNPASCYATGPVPDPPVNLIGSTTPQ